MTYNKPETCCFAHKLSKLFLLNPDQYIFQLQCDFLHNIASGQIVSVTVACIVVRHVYIFIDFYQF